MARRDGPLAQRGRVNSENMQNKNEKQMSHQRLARHRNRINTRASSITIIRTASLKRLHVKIDPKGPHQRILRLFKSATYQKKISYQRKYKEHAL